jgi:signal transduction histidine kinase
VNRGLLRGLQTGLDRLGRSADRSAEIPLSPGDAFRLRYQQLYVLLLRPIALALTLLTFLVYALLDPRRDVEELTIVVAVFLVLAPAVVALRSRWSLAVASRVALFCDTVLIAIAMSLFSRPEPGAIGFIWTIFIAGFLLTPRDTLFFTGLAVAASLLVPPIAVDDVQWLIAVSDMLALSLAGLLLYILGRQSRRYELRLTATQRRDRVALELTRRIGVPSAFRDRLDGFAAALGQAVGAGEVAIVFVEDPARTIRWLDGHAASSPSELRRRVSNPPLPAVDVIVRGRATSLDEADALLDRLSSQFAATVAEAELLHEHEVARQRMEELAQLREELVARVSHELRTPLTSIVGFLATLRRRDLRIDEEQRLAFLEIAEQEAQRLGRLVDDVLSVSRSRAERLLLADCDLAAACRQAAALVAASGGREIELDLADDTHVLADRDRVMEILVNLIENSRRHGEGRTTVHCGRADGGVQVAVSDEGGGVPPDLLPSLFQPFASGRQTGDTGLGLAVARSLAQAHGGSLTYSPPENGHPHAFVLWLPREPVTTQ